MLKKLSLLVLIPFLCFCQNNDTGTQTNPFLIQWDTPFQTPPFDQIKTEHYLPAFMEGIRQQNKEINAIVTNTEEPSFINSVEALEISGGLLQTVENVFNHLLQTESTPEMQQVSEDIFPVLSSHKDDIKLNSELFNKILAVYNKRDKLNPEQKRLVEKYYKDFMRGGTALNSGDKEKLKKINEELALLILNFNQNILTETNSFELVVDDSAELKGIPEPATEAARENAVNKGYPNKYLFTLQAPSFAPIIKYAENRNLREKVFKAYINRGNNNDENDNKEIISKIVSLRFQKAKLLGYTSFADYVISDYMAHDPETVYKFLDKINKPAHDLALKEASQLQEIVYSEGNDFKIEPWDWNYYSQKLKMLKYNLNDEELRPYFKLENVLDGVFTLSQKLYGIHFVERKDINTYHPDVKVFEVKDKDGSHLSIIYFDYFPREGKSPGAWMMPMRKQSKAGGKNITPIIMNCGNLNKPAEDKPSLLSLNEAKAVFHEFGHALHGLLSDVTYSSFSGVSVALDFVELPSQIMEKWAVHPDILRMYARHYKSGEIIPEELISRIQNSALFNKGYETLTYFFIPALLDMKYHDMKEDKKVDVDEVESEISREIIPEIGLFYKSTTNYHIFSEEYAAGYYSYLWSEVLVADAFEAFVETDIFDSKTAEAFRDKILSKGGSEDPFVLYKKFRGREPSPESMMKSRGLLIEKSR